MPPTCIRHSAKGSTRVILFNSLVSSNYVFTKSFLLREMYFPAPLKLDRIMGLSYGQKNVGRSNACHFQSLPLKTLTCSFACTLSLSFFSHWLAGGRGCRGGFSLAYENKWMKTAWIPWRKATQEGWWWLYELINFHEEYIKLNNAKGLRFHRCHCRS